MKLDLYIARRFVWSFFLVFTVFFAIVFLIDMVEQIRRFNVEGFGVIQAAELAMLNTPASMYRMLPLLVILATITLFLGLARSSEMVVTRAAGRSALRTLLSPTLTVLFFGALGVAALNPLVAATSKKSEVVAARYQSGVSSVLSVSDSALWLRQAAGVGQIVIRASQSNLDGTSLFDAVFYGFDIEGAAEFRIEAESAVLQNGFWGLTNARRWSFTDDAGAKAGAEEFEIFVVETDLTREQIQDSFGTPNAIPIWELPAFIRQLDRAGFSALQHRVWFHMELANPALLAAMVLIGAGFTMRHSRFGQTGMLVLFAILVGFGIFFLRNFAQVLGENGQIPVMIAAWAPPLAGICLSLGLLFHTEDG